MQAAGIDVEFYGKGAELEFDFIVAPGADPRRVLLELDGVKALKIDASGDLVLRTKSGREVVQRPPVVYQKTESGRRESSPTGFLGGEGDPVRGIRMRGAVQTS